MWGFFFLPDMPESVAPKMYPDAEYTYSTALANRYEVLILLLF